MDAYQIEMMAIAIYSTALQAKIATGFQNKVESGWSRLDKAVREQYRADARQCYGEVHRVTEERDLSAAVRTLDLMDGKK